MTRSHAPSKPKIGVAIFPECAIGEILELCQALRGRADLIWVGPAKAALTSIEGLPVCPHITYGEAMGIDFAAAIVPGGDFLAIKDDRSFDAWLQALAQRPGAVMGGICNGAILLLKAGVLRGCAVTHTAIRGKVDASFEELLDLVDRHSAGSEFADRDVVVAEAPSTSPGRRITAKPWAKADFAQAFLSALDAARPQ